MKAVTLKDIRIKGASIPKGTVIDEPKETVAALVRVKGVSCDADKIKAAAKKPADKIKAAAKKPADK